MSIIKEEIEFTEEFRRYGLKDALKRDADAVKRFEKMWVEKMVMMVRQKTAEQVIKNAEEM